MTVNVDLRVLHLLCSRLCHDLVGPVGAINNGVELVREFGSGNDEEAMDLVASSADQAAARLKFFRVAYGLATGAARTVRDAKGLADATIESDRMTLDWPADEGIGATNLDEGSVKLLLNMVFLAAEALSPAGTITVRLSPSDGRLAAELISEGDGVHLDDQELGGITGAVAPADLTPRSIQGYYTARLAEEQGTELTVAASEGSIRFAALLRLGD